MSDTSRSSLAVGAVGCPVDGGGEGPIDDGGVDVGEAVGRVVGTLVGLIVGVLVDTLSVA